MQYLLDFVCVFKVCNMHDTRVFLKVLSTQKHDALVIDVQFGFDLVSKCFEVVYECV